MKTCFKCSRELPLSDFYPHPQMKDGHLNKCKDCTRKDTSARAALLSKDPVWMEKEMERHRIKQRKARAAGEACVLKGEAKRKVQAKHRAKYPEKALARSRTMHLLKKGLLVRKPCEVCGSKDSEAHHDDYGRPIQVAWLCPKHHAERHVAIRRAARLSKL